jgi:nucleotide-binding universal stress UspA family protein
VADLDSLAAPVLALTKDAVALFTADASGVFPMDVELPSYGDVNWFVDREKQRQQHPDHAGTERSRHGHEPSARADEDLARFLREVDSALSDFETKTPLIVLGDDDVVSRFSNHSERATLSPPNSGITAPFAVDEMHRIVRESLAELEEQRVDAVIAEAVDRLGEGRATAEIEEALPAAVTGRVESIVMQLGSQPVWGRLDRSTLEVEAHDSHQPGDVDLLDRLVVWARDNGASLTSADMPIDSRPFVATFRY